MKSASTGALHGGAARVAGEGLGAWALLMAISVCRCSIELVTATVVVDCFLPCRPLGVLVCYRARGLSNHRLRYSCDFYFRSWALLVCSAFSVFVSQFKVCFLTGASVKHSRFLNCSLRAVVDALRAVVDAPGLQHHVFLRCVVCAALGADDSAVRPQSTATSRRCFRTAWADGAAGVQRATS